MVVGGGIVEPSIENQTGVWIYNSKTLTYSGMSLSDAIISGKSTSMTVLSKGRASNISAIASAKLHVSNGGKAYNITCGNAYVYVSSGGTVISFNAILYDSYLTVQGGGTATDIIAPRGFVNIAVNDKTRVSMTDGNKKFTVANGVAENFVLSKRHLLMISSGCTALNTVVSGGSLYILSGGIALGIEWRPGNGVLDINSSGIVAPINGLSGVYFNSTLEITTASVLSAMYLSGFSHNYGRVWVFSGGTASDCMIDSICSGGYAENCSAMTHAFVYSGGSVDSHHLNYGDNLLVAGRATNIICAPATASTCILSNGIASQITLHQANWLVVSSGGTALAVTEDGGSVQIDNGGIVDFVPHVMSGKVISHGTSVYDITIHSATMMVSCHLCGFRLNIYSGGLVEDTDMNRGGSINVYDGGVLSKCHNDADSYSNLIRSMWIFSGGVVDSMTFNALAESTNDKVLIIFNGGTATNITINTGDTVISNGGYLSNAIIDKKVISVCSGGTALGISLINGASAVVEDGGYIN